MNSDNLTLIGVLFSIAALIYTILHNRSKNQREANKEKIKFIRNLCEILDKTNFDDSSDKKDQHLDKFRDELDFAELTIEASRYILTLNLDDDFYILLEEKCLNSFKEQKRILANKIKSLKKCS